MTKQQPEMVEEAICENTRLEGIYKIRGAQAAWLCVPLHVFSKQALAGLCIVLGDSIHHFNRLAPWGSSEEKHPLGADND